LLANILENPTHPLVALDQFLASKAITLFNKVLGLVTTEQRKLQSLSGVINELMAQVAMAVEASKLGGGPGEEAFDESSSPELLMFLESQGQQMFGEDGEDVFGAAMDNVFERGMGFDVLDPTFGLFEGVN
jgi:hypothetical protein